MNSYKLHLEKQKALSSVEGGNWVRIFDWTPNAWQTNHPYSRSETSVLAHPIVFSCITLIQGDIAKLPLCVEQMTNGVWQKVEHDILKLLRKPNLYQDKIQFLEQWILSKLLYGNTYILKVRQGREVVGLIVLDPNKVTPLVSDFGEVYYQIEDDKLAMVNKTIVVPSTEVIHDRWNCIYHALMGMSPLFAGAAAANVGNSIIKDSKGFFGNGAKPSGILTAPGHIDEQSAQRLKETFETGFSGDNAGKVAVVGDGLTYEAMRMSSVDAQVVEQLGWSDEKICSVFHIPAYMVGVGDMPTYTNIEALTVQYYTQCLQTLMESLELCLNTGLNIQSRFRIQIDLDGLFRMDQATLFKNLGEGVKAGWMSPDEARQRVNLPPVPGGEYPYLQQQNYSLEALSKRDADDPFAKPEPVAPVVEEPEEEPTDEDIEDEARYLAMFLEKELKIEPEAA